MEPLALLKHDQGRSDGNRNDKRYKSRHESDSDIHDNESDNGTSGCAAAQ